MKVIIVVIINFAFLFSLINPSKESNAKGKKAFQKKNYELALNHFNDSFEKIPSDPKLIYNLGNAHFFKNEYDKAISFFKEALAKIKTDESNQEKELYFNLYFGLGNSYFYKKEFEEAIANYKKALKIDHKNINLKKNLELAIKELEEKKQNQPKKNQQKNSSSESSAEKKPKTSNEKSKKNSLNQDEKNVASEKQNPQQQNRKAIDKKTAEAILKAFETRHQDALIKKRYQQKSSNSPIDKNW